MRTVTWVSTTLVSGGTANRSTTSPGRCCPSIRSWGPSASSSPPRWPSHGAHMPQGPGISESHGSDLAPAGSVPVPAVSRESPAGAGAKFAAGLLFRGQVHERSTAGTREVHGPWYAHPRQSLNRAWQPGDMPGCGGPGWLDRRNERKRCSLAAPRPAAAGGQMACLPRAPRLAGWPPARAPARYAGTVPLRSGQAGARPGFLRGRGRRQASRPRPSPRPGRPSFDGWRRDADRLPARLARQRETGVRVPQRLTRLATRIRLAGRAAAPDRVSARIR
jgi:hypothetical protein